MLHKFTRYTLTTILILIPLFFWTLTPNFFTTPKSFILIFGVLVLLLLSLLALFRPHPLKLPSPAFALPLVLIVFATVATLLANPEGRPEALGGKGMILLILPLLALIAGLTTSLRQATLHSLLLVSGILSLHSLLSLTFLSKLTSLPLYMQTPSFTPTGNYLTTLVVILIGTSTGFSLLYSAKDTHKPFYGLLSILGLVASIAIVALMLPGGALTPTLLNLSASWSIALDALKSLRALAFGIGLSNYSLLYTAVRPISLNLTPLWNSLPVTASTEILTLLPTAGITLTLSLIYLMAQTLRRAVATPLFLPSLLTVISFWLIPADLTLYTLLFFLYALGSHPASFTHNPSKTIRQTLATVVVVLIIAIIYITGGVFAGEYFMRQAQKAIDNNDSQRVYDLHLRALQTSPSLTDYHLSFARINFHLASAFSQKEDLSDQDRSTITSLVQQSIDSGKIAISLRPNDSRTWLTLAQVYSNLINVADGAEQFTLDSYAKTISLDRANPLLRLEYATLLAQIADLPTTDSPTKESLTSQAMLELQTAIQLKADYTDAYYNLAKLYEKTGDLTRAIASMTKVLELLTPQSPDYATITKELDALKASQATPPNSPTPEPAPTPDLTELSQPEPLPSPLPGGPIEIDPE